MKSEELCGRKFFMRLFPAPTPPVRLWLQQFLRVQFDNSHRMHQLWKNFQFYFAVSTLLGTASGKTFMINKQGGQHQACTNNTK